MSGNGNGSGGGIGGHDEPSGTGGEPSANPAPKESDPPPTNK